MSEIIKKHLEQIYQAALLSVSGRQSIIQFLQNYPISQDIYLIAIGKVAPAMASGALEALGSKIKDGLVIGRKEYFFYFNLPFTCVEGSHPVPTEKSLEAGDKLLSFIKQIPESAHVLFLISGGASSLVEVLKEEYQLKDLQLLNNYLLGSGMDISEINSYRKQVSKIKGGGLIDYLGDRSVTQILIVDVPSQKYADVGSGLLFKDNITVYPCHSIASIFSAFDAAKACAMNLGYQVEVKMNLLSDDVNKVAEYLVREIKQGPPRLIIAGGEPTVQSPGKTPGGRNQHLALKIAQLIAGEKNIYFLALDTDGYDGKTAAAGALVDGNTIAIGELLNLNAMYYLNKSEAHTFLKATNSLIFTGPTETNIMDLFLVLKT